jgi:hypothetical protein
MDGKVTDFESRVVRWYRGQIEADVEGIFDVGVPRIARFVHRIG